LYQKLIDSNSIIVLVQLKNQHPKERPSNLKSSINQLLLFLKEKRAFENQNFQYPNQEPREVQTILERPKVTVSKSNEKISSPEPSC